MIAVKSGNYFFVYDGNRTYVVEEGIAQAFPFPKGGEVVLLDEDTPSLISAVEKAKREGIFLGVRNIVLPSGVRVKIGEAGKDFPADINFFLEFLPNYQERIRRRTKRVSPSQGRKAPTTFSW